MFRRKPRELERFTLRARRVLSLAQEEAERRHSYFIEPEHVLVGFLQEEGGVARKVLDRLDLTLEAVQSTIDAETPPFSPKKASPVDLSPDTKKLLYKAVDEARSFGHNYIGTEHLLLGLLRLEHCTAQMVLAHNGIAYQQIREGVIQVIMQHNASNSSSATFFHTTFSAIYSI
jgi:ATP-dependent Clp protease ATP-binding subunit ClpC